MVQAQQSDLFLDPDGGLSPVPGVQYIPDVLPEHEKLFQYLRDNMSWNEQFQSRKTVTFGVSYNYRKGTRRQQPMAPFLEPVCELVRSHFGYHPNNCLANYYPTGDHYISFHSDQDMEMKNRTGVTIISLGSVREMALRRVDNHSIRHFYALEPGSAFFMEDEVQKTWQHGILKRAGTGPRISLSLRSLRTETG